MSPGSPTARNAGSTTRDGFRHDGRGRRFRHVLLFPQDDLRNRRQILRPDQLTVAAGRNGIAAALLRDVGRDQAKSHDAA
jgi:hypothetical protein